MLYESWNSGNSLCWIVNGVATNVRVSPNLLHCKPYSVLNSCAVGGAARIAKIVSFAVFGLKMSFEMLAIIYKYLIINFLCKIWV